MPIVALPPSNTARYKLQYTVGGLQHEVQNLVGPAVDNNSASLAFVQLFTRLNADLYLVSIQGMTFAPAGSDIFNPVAYSGALSFGAGAPAPEQAIRSISFVGRTPTGRKARHFVYGFKANLTDNMRITIAENANVAAWITDLATYAAQWLAIDGVKPVYAGYGNLDYNDHWQKEIRG
jgi:hypothetical protein